VAWASAPPSSIPTTTTDPSLSKFYTLEDRETKIVQGVVVERPAWEDLITVGNLRTRLDELDAHLDSLRSDKDHHSE
jgi:hypothetical protein